MLAQASYPADDGEVCMCGCVCVVGGGGSSCSTTTLSVSVPSSSVWLPTIGRSAPVRASFAVTRFSIFWQDSCIFRWFTVCLDKYIKRKGDLSRGLVRSNKFKKKLCPCDQQLGVGEQKKKKKSLDGAKVRNGPHRVRSVRYSWKVHCHVSWLAQIRAELNEKAPGQNNCKGYISDWGGKKTPLLSLVFLPSSLLSARFCRGPRIDQWAGRPRQTSLCYTSKASTRTRRNTPEVKRPAKKHKHRPLFRELGPASPMIREKSEGRGGCGCADDVTSGHTCLIRFLWGGICTSERTGGCQSAEAPPPGNVTVVGSRWWHDMANH